jgi:hypothetical protein
MKNGRRGGWAWAALALVSCARETERPAPPVVERPAAAVAGEPVPREWVSAAARTYGLEVEEALGRAVEVTVLGRLARERGIDRWTTLAGERRSVLVRALLAREVELADPPTERDRAELARTYGEHRSWFVHPEIRTVEHLAIVLDETGGRGGGPRGYEPAPAEAWEEARQVLARFRVLASGAETPEAFAALQPVLDRRWRERWLAAGRAERGRPRAAQEKIGPFDRQGPFDPAFVAAAFALAEAGALSQPVQTAYGWHLLYLREVSPARDDPFEAAVGEVRERAETGIEAQRAAGIVREASGRRGVRVHPELLSLTQRGGREDSGR